MLLKNLFKSLRLSDGYFGLIEFNLVITFLLICIFFLVFKYIFNINFNLAIIFNPFDKLSFSTRSGDMFHFSISQNGKILG